MNVVEHVQPASFGPGYPGPAPSPSLTPGRLTAAQSAVLDVLAAQPHPVGILQLAALTNLHSNTIREHLDALVEAELVSRTTATPHGRGRPSWQYRAVPVPTVNQNTELALALASELARQAPDAAEAAIQAGRRWGNEQSRGSEQDRQSGAESGTGKGWPGSGVAQVMENLRQLGFDPDDSNAPDDSSGQIEIRLHRCPMLAAAKTHPEITCNVHLGLVQGWLDEMAKTGHQRDESGGHSAELTPGMRAFAGSDYCLLTLRTHKRVQQPPGASDGQ
ncbi:helix-turn-helix domain-containing protein [Arthrobacter pigmenti]